LLASQTKLLTAVAALQIVERGLIAFDDDVEELLPELAGQQVLTGYDADDKPVLEKRTVGITFRYENSLYDSNQRRRSAYPSCYTDIRSSDISSPIPQAQPTMLATRT
jgi:hypothetical protein